MAPSMDSLKTLHQDYLLARWENNELAMQPFCSCGSILGEDYFCSKCNRECDCTFIMCEDPQALSVVQKLIQGNPSFRNYKASLLNQ